MARNNSWGSDSSEIRKPLMGGWADNVPKQGTQQPVLTDVSKSEMTELEFISKHRATLVELFGENFASDSRYKLALAEVLMGKRSVHMILTDYRPSDRTKKGGTGW